MTGLDGINSLHTVLSSLNVNDAAPVAETQAKATTAKGADLTATQATGTTDRASFSAAAGLAAQATDNSDVRLTKVAELRQAIASGTYNVPASAVADKIVEGLLR